MPEMLELILRFGRVPNDAADNALIPLSVHVPDLGLDTEPHDFVPPLGDPELREIRWYLEQYPDWPVGPDYHCAGAHGRGLACGAGFIDPRSSARAVLDAWSPWAGWWRWSSCARPCSRP